MTAAEEGGKTKSAEVFCFLLIMYFIKLERLALSVGFFEEVIL